MTIRSGISQQHTLLKWVQSFSLPATTSAISRALLKRTITIPPMRITSTKITRTKMKATITRKAGTVTQSRVTRTILMVTNSFS